MSKFYIDGIILEFLKNNIGLITVMIDCHSVHTYLCKTRENNIGFEFPILILYLLVLYFCSPYYFTGKCSTNVS